MTEPAFNLSAEISLQLAKGAAASLKKDIEKAFSTKVEVDPSTLAADLKKATQAAKKAAKPIEVPITFKLADRAKQDAAVKRAIGKITVDVELNKTSIAQNITSAKLQAAMGNRTLKAKVQAIFDEKGAKKLKELEKFIKQTTKEYERLGGAAATAANAANAAGDNAAISVKQLGEEASESSEKFRKLIGRISNLTKSTSKQFGGGKFFKESRDEIRNLLSEMDKLTKGKGLELLEKKFKGLDGNSAKNLESSLKTIFKAYGDLEIQSKKLDAAQAKSPNKNFGVERKALEDARIAVGKFFRELDSADPQTFAIAVTSVMREVGQVTRSALIGAERDIQRFDALLSNLNQKKAGINASAGRGVTRGAVDDLIEYVEIQQKLGQTKEQVIASPRFQELNALLGELKYVDQAAQRASSSLDALLYKSKTTGLGDTLGGRNTGYTKKVADITAKAQGEIDGSSIAKNNQQTKDRAAQDIANLTTRSEKLNATFGRIIEKFTQFKADGFKNAATAVRKLGFEIYRLAQSGESLQNLDRATTVGLAQINSLKALDAKVKTSINQIERLRNALNFSPTEDIAGAKPALDNLQKSLEGKAGQFKGLTEASLNQGLSKSLFDIRGMQKFNEAAELTRTKIVNIQDSSENLGAVDVYQGYLQKFESGSKTIASSSDTVGEKLKKLKQLSDNTLIRAKFDSEGGFFGSIAKSAGLATKRLAAFLVLAQGLYAIQGVLSASFAEAIKVDKEFTKLEQVLNKDFSSTKLEVNLRNLENQIKSLGKTLGVSTLEVANAAQILAQAGIYGTDLAKLLDTISKSQLGPTFGNAGETAEATIAIFRQFNLTAEQTQDALGGINRLSAKYAVEAKGITEAVRRAGGVFSSSGDDIGSFSAAFTLVKQKTREADEAIATGLRNIAQRLQTANIQSKVKELLNVDLVENGEFIGFEQAIGRVGKALEGVSTKSSKFAQVREAIAGARQGGRLTPLLTDYKQFDELTKEFAKGARSIDEDVSVAFESIENKIERAKSAVTDLFHEIISSKFVKFLVEGFTQIVTVATTLLKTLNSVTGAIFAIGVAAKIFGASKFVGQAFFSQISARTPLPFAKNKGGSIGFNKGSRGGTGLIPGGGPNKDSLLAYLTTGEYVLKRKAVKKYGTTFLDNLNDGTINANKGGPIRRNSGGIIPGFNTGGLSGSGGVSSLFNGFVGFIKKVIGLGSAIEKTAQEIQTGFNLPELFDRPTNPRSSPIDIDLISVLRDQSKTTIDAIKNAGSFVEGRGTSGDKFLPKPGTPELPSSIMDGIIKDALKTPAKTKIPVQPYKGNSGQLRNLSKEAGIDIPKKLFTQLFKGVKIVSSKEDIHSSGGASGSFNKRNKIATFTEAGVFNPKLIAHEIGHGLEVVVTGKLKGIASALQKGGTGDRTRQRLIKSGIYGKEGTKEFDKKFNSESLADIFKEATALKSGKGENISDNDKSLLNLFSNVLKKQTGITITGRSKSNDSAIGLSGVLDNLKQTDTERALGAGVRLPGSFNKPLSAASQGIIDKRNNTEVRNSSSSGNFRSIIEAIRSQGAFKGGTKGAVVAAGTRNSSSIAAAVKSVNPSSFKGSPFSSSAGGGIAAFGKSIFSSKTNLLGLAASAFALQSVFTGFDSGLTQLITAMASAAASMYTLSQAANAVGFAKNALGIGAKNVQVSKAKSIAQSFIKSNPKKGISDVDRQSHFDLSALDFNSGKRKIAGSVGGFKSAERTKSVLANIRGSAPGAGVIPKAVKSPLAAANLIAGKEVGGLGKILGKFSGGAKALSGEFTDGAIGVGLLIGAMDFFVGSLEEGANAGKEKAKTAEEYVAAGAKGRLAGALKTPIKALGAAGSGALTGAAIGTMILPGIGTAVGAIAGALVGLGVTFSDKLSTTFPVIDGLVTRFKSQLSLIFKSMSDGIYVAVENITNGEDFSTKLSGIADLLSFGGSPVGTTLKAFIPGQKDQKDTYGGKRLALAEKKDTLDFNVKKTGKDFSRLGLKQGTITQEQLVNLQGKTNLASGLLYKGKQPNGPNSPGAEFADFNESAKTAITTEIQDVADVYKAASPKNRKIILDSYKSQGQDLKALAEEVGVVIDEAGTDITTAFSELSVFFIKMKNVTELSSARLSGLEGALQNFSDPSKISTDLPSQFFDILKQGIDPSTLGFGDTFKQGLADTGNRARAFDPRLAQNADFEINGRRAANNASTALINSGATFNNKTDSAVTDIVGGAFSAANGNNAQLDEAFSKFLGSKSADDKTGLINGDGKIDGQKVNELFKEFADTLDTGALDQIKRLNDLSKQYTDQYKSHMAARFALENEAIGLLQDNVSKRKSLGDVSNKAKGLVGDKLAAAQGAQAQISSEEKLGLTLSGTGLGGNANVAQIQSSLIASQERGRNAAQIAAQGGGTQAQIDTRRAQIEGGSDEEQKRLKAALQLIANGTDSAAHNMGEFERALEKAANSSKFLTDALLGSDDQMHQTVLGIQAFDKVQAAFKSGGVSAAQQTLATFSSDSKQALGSYVGQDSQNQADFNSALGISNNISGGKEAKQVGEDSANQQAANEALVSGLNNNASVMTENINKMQAIYDVQFKNTQQIVQQAEATSKALVERIAALPEVIKYEAQVTVKLEGAAGLVELQNGMKEFVENLIVTHLKENNNKLVDNNQGLNRP